MDTSDYHKNKLDVKIHWFKGEILCRVIKFSPIFSWHKIIILQSMFLKTDTQMMKLHTYRTNNSFEKEYNILKKNCAVTVCRISVAISSPFYKIMHLY